MNTAIPSTINRASPGELVRWECGCTEPPILLAMYQPAGQIEIKVRDRFYLVAPGCVTAICPRCKTLHMLDTRLHP
jgi:hypothetical protein